MRRKDSILYHNAQRKNILWQFGDRAPAPGPVADGNRTHRTSAEGVRAEDERRASGAGT